MSWKKWMKNAVTGDEDGFITGISADTAEAKALNKILESFPMSVPEYYLSLINWDDPADPIRKMCIPSLAELNMTGDFDTSGEVENTVINGMQHKYNQTALVLSTHNCAMYCRHCFRKRLVGLTGDEAMQHFDEMIEYISTHKEISNVLISGGDSLVNSNATIERYLAALSEIEHLDFIRFGTRTPVVVPQRIYEDPELLSILKKHDEKKNILIVTQFNHPAELTAESKKAIDALHEAGIDVKNQTVLLRGVNDSVETLTRLMSGLTRFGIIPYYVFQCRPVSGVGSHFQVPLKTGSDIIEKTRARLCGPAKSFRYAMSHITGKIEIIGNLPDGRTVFKYHQAKHPQDTGRIFTHMLDDSGAWLEDIPQ